MSQLVKARQKRREDLPAWALCCEEFASIVSQGRECVFDISEIYKQPKLCAYCHADHGVLTGAIDVSDGLCDALELYDLDEGAA